MRVLLNFEMDPKDTALGNCKITYIVWGNSTRNIPTRSVSIITPKHCALARKEMSVRMAELDANPFMIICYNPLKVLSVSISESPVRYELRCF